MRHSDRRLRRSLALERDAHARRSATPVEARRRRGCEVRSRIVPSTSHFCRDLGSTNASKTTSTGTAIVFDAYTVNPSACWCFSRIPLVRWYQVLIVCAHQAGTRCSFTRKDTVSAFDRERAPHRSRTPNHARQLRPVFSRTLSSDGRSAGAASRSRAACTRSRLRVT